MLEFECTERIRTAYREACRLGWSSPGELSSLRKEGVIVPYSTVVSIRDHMQRQQHSGHPVCSGMLSADQHVCFLLYSSRLLLEFLSLKGLLHGSKIHVPRPEPRAKVRASMHMDHRTDINSSLVVCRVIGFVDQGAGAT